MENIMTYLFPLADSNNVGVVSAGNNIVIANGVISANASSGGGNTSVGTWTPTLTTNGSGTIATSVRSATYSKTGQQVICMFHIKVTGCTGGNDKDAVILGALPYTSTTGNGYVGGVSITYFANLASLNYFVSGSVKSNGTTAPLWSAPIITDTKTITGLSSYSQTALNQSDLQTNSELSGTVTYLSAT
jgi:hypothetical protein